MLEKKCLPGVPLSCRKGLFRVKVPWQVTQRWPTQTQVPGLWARLMASDDLFLKLFYCFCIFFFIFLPWGKTNHWPFIGECVDCTSPVALLFMFPWSSVGQTLPLTHVNYCLFLSNYFSTRATQHVYMQQVLNVVTSAFLLDLVRHNSEGLGELSPFPELVCSCGGGKNLKRHLSPKIQYTFTK